MPPLVILTREANPVAEINAPVPFPPNPLEITLKLVRSVKLKPSERIASEAMPLLTTSTPLTCPIADPMI